MYDRTAVRSYTCDRTGAIARVYRRKPSIDAPNGDLYPAHPSLSLLVSISAAGKHDLVDQLTRKPTNNVFSEDFKSNVDGYVDVQSQNDNLLYKVFDSASFSTVYF